MLKKAKAAAAGGDAGEGAKPGSQSVLNSSRQIWLAGLGAFSRAQKEGMKVFESLVQQGEALETKTKHAAVSTAEAAREGARAKAKEMQAAAGGTWDKLEQVFEARVAKALGRLGVHTSTDVERLTERVNALSESVNALLKANGIAPPAPPGGMRRMVDGAVKSAGRRAAKTVSSATSTAANTVSSATRTARRTVKTATKIAKAALK